MKICLLIFLFFAVEKSFSQKVKNEFFVLHNIIRGDSTYNTFEKQVALIKNAGYDGIEINSVDHFEGMKIALDRFQFQASYFYVKISLDSPYTDKRLENYIRQLKGSHTIIAPYIVKDSLRRYNGRGADIILVRLLSQISNWAEQSDLQVAIYPHVNFYVETTDHAVALAKSIDRGNLGLSFNLCHWLATTTASERNNLQVHLKTLLPYLKMVTICGANNVITQKPNIWDDYILPLGTGSFDTYGLVKFINKELKSHVPIGVQCYDIKTDKYQLVNNTMKVWRQYVQRLENEK